MNEFTYGKQLPPLLMLLEGPDVHACSKKLGRCGGNGITVVTDSFLMAKDVTINSSMRATSSHELGCYTIQCICIGYSMAVG